MKRKSFERIIVRSNDTWGSSEDVEAPRIQEAQIQHLRQRQRERKTDSSSDKVTIRNVLAGIVKTRYRQC